MYHGNYIVWILTFFSQQIMIYKTYSNKVDMAHGNISFTPRVSCLIPSQFLLDHGKLSCSSKAIVVYGSWKFSFSFATWQKLLLIWTMEIYFHVAWQFSSCFET